MENKKIESLVEKQLKTILPRLSERIESGNINFLIGSGVSKPFLPTLNNIEDDINEAIKNEDTDKQVLGYKEYLNGVMFPNKKFLDYSQLSEEIYKDKTTGEKLLNKNGIERSEKIDFFDTNNSYKEFLITINQLLLDRKTTILNKQVNIFTTNIDIFFEQNLEELELHYNDGFLGKMNPVFDLSNFKQSIIQRSHHFDNKSEIPVFNLLKIHGSVNWKYKESELTNPDRKIYLSTDLSHIDKKLLTKTGEDFIKNYKEQVLVVNPEDAKFSETVLNKYYYELLRSYSSELEKVNSLLFIIGFSMADQHIREITKRSAKSNPTLQIYIFTFSKGSKKDMEDKMEVSKNKNIKIISPEYEDETEKYNYDLETITKENFKKINNQNLNNEG